MLEQHYEYINSLVERVKQNDTQALADLFDFYNPLIQASITRCIKYEPALKNLRSDLEREAYLILNTLVQSFDPELTWFSYFLQTHFDYALLSKARKSYLSYTTATKGVQEIAFDDLPSGFEFVDKHDPFNQIWQQEILTKALDELNPKQREAIELYFFQNMTQEMAAEALNISQGSFCKRLKRALTQLRELIPEEILME